MNDKAEVSGGVKKLGRDGGRVVLRGWEEPAAGRREENPKIEVRTEDQAVVVSAFYITCGDRKRFLDILKAALEKLAAEINEKGGITGHIKAAVDACDTTVISVTDRTADLRSAEAGELTVRMAAIVFFVEEEEMLKLVTEMFESLETAASE